MMSDERPTGTTGATPLQTESALRPSFAWLWTSLNVLLLVVFGLASGRLLYEWQFPRLLWLAQPLAAVSLALLIAIVASLLLRRALDRPRLTATLAPLLLNLAYLPGPTVDLVRGRFLFFAALWLSAALFVGGWWVEEQRSRGAEGQRRIRSLFGIVLILVALAPVYLLTMSNAVGQADTFEFQVVAPQLGIAHPTGYPLYLLLGKLFTLLPVNTVAWRMNFASAVYAFITIILIYQLGRLIGQQALPRPTRNLPIPQSPNLQSPISLSALIAAVALGLSPTFWSQAIIAEVYTLHALLVALALTLMVALLRVEVGSVHQKRLSLLLAFICGLALTNHLTSVFLLPGAAVAILVVLGRQLKPQRREETKTSFVSLTLRGLLLNILQLAVAFALPLLLYAYLPLRWQAVNNEPMGLGRFVDWVVGGRFQGALQWFAWLNDSTRYEVVGRLFLQNWGWFYLLLALLGFLFLLWRQRLIALVLLLTWFGFTFYTLNYYVPDLAVFLIPAHLVIALCLAVGGGALLYFFNRRLGDWETERLNATSLPASQSPSLPISNLSVSQSLSLLIFAIPAIWLGINHWAATSHAGEDGLLTWGEGVLAMPLAANAAVLADSEKIAPLYYLQQAEGVRPDLEIMVLPDEAAYRAELDGRVAAGQTVYLARFLPGLAGTYHLRSVGPLVEAGNGPLETLPPGVTAADRRVGPLELLVYTVEPTAAVDSGATAVTLYWRKAADADPTDAPVVYLRWSGPDFAGRPIIPEGQHPVSNNYPINAWKGHEIVPDFYLLPHPRASCQPPPAACHYAIEVATAPPYTAADDLNWQAITTIPLPPPTVPLDGRPYRAQFASFLLETAAFPSQVRPGTPLAVAYYGYGDGEALAFELRPIGSGGAEEQRSGGEMVSCQLSVVNCQLGRVYVQQVETMVENGRYHLLATNGDGTTLCGWFHPSSFIVQSKIAHPSGCTLGEIEISGVPLAPGATNFDDKIALLDIDLPEETLQPGGQLSLGLTWQSLADMGEDYTVFVQVLDERDQIVGQVDSWPVQGSYPTSQWRVGEVVRDPYVVQLQGDLQPGTYRLHIGWYLLATLRRLPVSAEDGTLIDDKVVVEGLIVP